MLKVNNILKVCILTTLIYMKNVFLTLCR